MEAREAGHAREAVVRHLSRGGVVLAQGGPQGAALHLHLRRGGDTGGGVGVYGTPRHPHPSHHGSPAHPAHPTHAAHPTHPAHPPGHGRGQQGLPLPPLCCGSLEDVLGSELVLRVHPHLVHVGQQTCGRRKLLLRAVFKMIYNFPAI